MLRLTNDQQMNVNTVLEMVLLFVPKKHKVRVGWLLNMIADYLDGLWQADIARNREEVRKDAYARGLRDGAEGAGQRAKEYAFAEAERYQQRVKELAAEQALREQDQPRVPTEDDEWRAILRLDPIDPTKH